MTVKRLFAYWTHAQEVGGSNPLLKIEIVLVLPPWGQSR